MERSSLQLTTTGNEGQTVPYAVPFLAFPGTSGKLVIQAPGAGEPKEGAWNRYVRLGEHLQARDIASLVSFNPPWPDAQGNYPDEPYSYRDASWNRIYVEGMAHLVEHCLANAERLCGTKHSEVCLAGFSAGGSVAVAVAPLFTPVRKILLVSAYDSVGRFFLHGLRHYTGETFVAYAEGDIPAMALAATLRSLARRASGVQACGIPNCDHAFSGETNGRIFGQAYLWAFAGDGSFPSAEGGVHLYE